MTEYRQATLAALQEIVNEKQAVRFRWENKRDAVLVDLFTASKLINIYDLLKDEGKEKFKRMLATRNNFIKLCNFALSKS